MKITFKPLNDPAPVRPADMPEGVGYEYEFAGSKRIGINHDNHLCHVDSNEQPFSRQWKLTGVPASIRVLKRRDGQPLPGPEPVPLDTLEPFPVWYRDAVEKCYLAHDNQGGYMAVHDEGEISMFDEIVTYQQAVFPQPHIMEVQL